VNPNIIVSGIGEQPAIVHLRQFHLNGFTSGCICVRPELSQEMLLAIKAKNWERAEEIRKIFEPLENLRNSINPIRVLHSAVRLAGIADTGPVLPMLSPPTEMEEEIIAVAAKALRGKH
jgi:dihydrodipicolinate synthase/N-acetylneuraminate lyase